MSRPVVIEVLERASGKVDLILSHGKDGRERVRVVLTTFRTFVCMTHVRADDCEHSAVARAYYEEHGTAQPVGVEG